MSKKKIAFLSVSVALLLSLLGGALFGQAATQKNNVYRYLSIFTEVFDLVRNNYVEQVPPDQLMDGAFSGVTDAIDEFSYYVPPAQMAAYKNFTDTDDNGTGLIVTRRFGYAYVISAVPGSPAATGLLPAPTAPAPRTVLQYSRRRRWLIPARARSLRRARSA